MPQEVEPESSLNKSPIAQASTAAVLATVLGTLSESTETGQAVALALGSVVGVFGPRILDKIQKRKTPDYGPDPDKE